MYLLAEADARAGVEGEEYERIWDKVLVKTIVEESIRIEFVSYRESMT